MIEDQNTTLPNNQEQAPRILILLLVAVVIFALSHLFQFIQVLTQSKTLSLLGLEITPIYLALDGLIWGAIGFFMAWSIWAKRVWSPVLGSLFTILYSLYFWIDQLFISQQDFLARRLPVNLVFTIFGLSAILTILNLRSTRAYFGKNTVKIT